MAVDHALLDSADRMGQLTLRFYQWSEPTVSLGYFQPIATRTEHLPSSSCPLVRRSTGGGAIIHDAEITYSLCVPSNNRWAAEHERLYTLMHQTAIEMLADMGIQARLFSTNTDDRPASGSSGLAKSRSQPSQQAEPFLCFLRRSNGDVVVDGNKIIGSAQRRRKNGLLQHGSLLLHRSRHAPELLGIGELSDAVEFQPGALIADWSKRLIKKLGWSVTSGSLTDDERAAVSHYEVEFYGHPKWNDRR